MLLFASVMILPLPGVPTSCSLAALVCEVVMAEISIVECCGPGGPADGSKIIDVDLSQPIVDHVHLLGRWAFPMPRKFFIAGN